MSKTFKSDNERDKTLGIDALDDRIRLEIEDRKHLIAIIIDNSQAAALALAILEAAGVVPVQRDYESYDDGTPAHLQAVAYFLKQHNEAQERATAEAREQAELEAEALELFNLHESLQSDAETVWLAVARRARELAKGATK